MITATGVAIGSETTGVSIGGVAMGSETAGVSIGGVAMGSETAGVSVGASVGTGVPGSGVDVNSGSGVDVGAGSTGDIGTGALEYTSKPLVVPISSWLYATEILLALDNIFRYVASCSITPAGLEHALLVLESCVSWKTPVIEAE